MIEHRIQGIPCLLRVDSFHHVEPQGRYADSDWDCYGYTEIEYTVCTTKGKEAPWLQRKMNDSDCDAAEAAIIAARSAAGEP